jgi:hypothetical protein
MIPIRFFYYIKRFWEIPLIEKLLLTKSLFLLLLIKFLVQSLPLKSYLFLLKKRPKYFFPDNNKLISIKIAFKTLQRALFILPFHCNCMVKSITMKLLLNSSGIDSKITLSVIKTHDSLLNAHAFLKIEKFHNFLERKHFQEVCTLS